MSNIGKSIKMAYNLHLILNYSGLNEKKIMNFKPYYTSEKYIHYDH